MQSYNMSKSEAEKLRLAALEGQKETKSYNMHLEKISRHGI